MVFRRWFIMGTLLTAAVMLSAGSCAGLPGETADRRSTVTVSESTNHTGRQTSRPASYVPGEVLVQFAEDADEETIAAIEKNCHVTVKRVLKPSRLYLMNITDGSTVQDSIDRLRKNKAVEYAEPNYIKRIR